MMELAGTEAQGRAIARIAQLETQIGIFRRLCDDEKRDDTDSVWLSYKDISRIFGFADGEVDILQ